MRLPFKLLLLLTFTIVIVGGSWFAWSVQEAGKISAAEMTHGNPDVGKMAIQNYGCAACHTIPGIPGAYGNVGPSLKQIGSRNYIAGVMKNTPQNLIRWIENPPAIDAKTAMPHLRITEPDARNIAAYLYTLQ
jgi:cytochrome c